MVTCSLLSTKLSTFPLCRIASQQQRRPSKFWRRAAGETSRVSSPVWFFLIFFFSTALNVTLKLTAASLVEWFLRRDHGERLVTPCLLFLHGAVGGGHFLVATQQLVKLLLLALPRLFLWPDAFLVARIRSRACHYCNLGICTCSVGGCGHSRHIT